MGWFTAAMVDIIKYLPKNHPQYNAMITLLGNLAEGIKNTQDPATGLWYQVTDKGSQSDDFLESSGSGLFIYTLKNAVDCGLIDKSYLTVAQKGWTGLKTKITLDAQGLPVINGYVGAMSALAGYALYVGQALVACPPSVHPHGYCAILMAASAMELQTVPKYRLSITIVGQGNVSNPSGEMFLDSGSTVSLTATPGSGYHFSQWSVDASGTAATESVTMNGEKNITATFSQGASIINASAINEGLRSSANVKDRRIFVRSLPGTPIRLYNMSGATVYTGKIPAESETVLTLHAYNGVYLLKMGSVVESLFVH
jgi:hypothetical protein